MSAPRRLAAIAAAGLGEIIGLLETLPERLTVAIMEAWADVGAGTTWFGRLMGLLAVLALILLPNWADRPLLLAMIAVLWLAYAGQAWNLLSGLAGQMSLGHALFVGGGAWLASVLLVRADIGPWLGLGLVVPAAALVGLAVGWIGLRGGLAGVGFAIFTLLAAEAGHIAATAAGVQAVPAAALLPEFHNKPIAAYYLILAMAAAALLISRHLLRSRLGCCWLAVREDPMVAAASGIDVLRTRLSALMISAALTAPAGVFLAYAATPADLDRLFSSSLSLEIMLSAVVGGLGTLLGPVIGALVLAPLDQALTGWAASRPHPLPGLVPLCYGAILMVMVMARSRGLWPWLAPRLGLVPAFEDEDGDGGGDGDGDDGDGDRRS